MRFIAAYVLSLSAGLAGDTRADPPPAAPVRSAASVMIEAWHGAGPRKVHETRTLASLSGFTPAASVSLSRYGGWAEGPKLKATGFFRTEKIGGRWWLVDPDGCRFLHVAVCAVQPDLGPQSREVFNTFYRSPEDWARKTVAQLTAHGFNGTGAWSADDLLARARPRPVYTRLVSFMGSFGRKLGIVRQLPGHLGYPDGVFPVFDPRFPEHCEEVARSLADTRADPFLLGLYSDNELPVTRTSLDLHLKMPPESPGRREAEAWLARRRGGRPAPAAAAGISEADREAWLGHVYDRYFEIVARAIRRADPNHLYLGPRLHGWAKFIQPVWAAAGRHLDVVAINVYGEWTPAGNVRQWAAWSGKPVLVTEWYVKGADSGLPNLSGAGWTVPTQADRGRFYQHFALSLLESGGCVGWHWFKYADNDPTNLRADPSNRDSNKGVVTARFEPYTALLHAMKELNVQAYPLTRHFDARSAAPPALRSGQRP